MKWVPLYEQIFNFNGNGCLYNNRCSTAREMGAFVAVVYPVTMEMVAFVTIDIQS